jgi:hypothetical protein
VTARARNYGDDCYMKSGLLIGVGVLATIAGIIFALQGAGVLRGSSMSGTTLWTVLGPLIALAGIALAALGLRNTRSARRPS